MIGCEIILDFKVFNKPGFESGTKPWSKICSRAGLLTDMISVAKEKGVKPD